MTLLDERVWPRDCTFLVAIPTRKTDFTADLRNVRKDFVRSHYGNVKISDDAKWDAYRPTADDIERLMERARDRGVCVVAKATLADWIRAQEGSKVVILFAHWRSGLLRTEDVNWTSIEEPGLSGAQQGKAREVMKRIVTEAHGDLSEVTKQLNETLLNGQLGEHPWFGNQANQRRASEQHRIYANRRFLDEAFPGTFGSSTSVEFADGLAPIDEVADATRSEYVGILDMSVCNSILLAELIKARAPNCVVVATQLPAIVDFRVVFYDALFRLLRRGRPYVGEIERLRKRILRLLGEGK